MFGMPRKGDIDYSVDLELNLGDVQPSVAGPKRPQDRINLPELGDAFRSLLQKPVKDGGYGKRDGDLGTKHPVQSERLAPGTMATCLQPTSAIRESSRAKNATKLEMVSNRPTPDTARELKKKPPIRFITGKARSDTAPF